MKEIAAVIRCARFLRAIVEEYVLYDDHKAWSIEAIDVLENMALGHGENVATANDPKLSDGGAWRGSCGVKRKRGIQATKEERTDETRPDKK